MSDTIEREGCVVRVEDAETLVVLYDIDGKDELHLLNTEMLQKSGIEERGQRFSCTEDFNNTNTFDNFQPLPADPDAQKEKEDLDQKLKEQEISLPKFIRKP